MLKVQENYSLKKHNSFNINVKCKFYAKCTDIKQIKDLLSSKKFANKKKLILGGGNNILFTKDFDGLVIKPDIKGISVINETEDNIFIKANAGEDWDEFVNYCVNRNWAGIENLSYIPGKVGTSPIQNIGAYGVEAKDVIEEVETLDINTLNTISYRNEQCKFGYRNSIFKTELKNKVIVTSVIFKLSKKLNYRTHYGNLNIELEKYSEITLSTIRQAIINIRKNKLPDPKKNGNAGSFFKNPYVSEKIAAELQKKYLGIPLYHLPNKQVKIAAGWLIENAGWKGHRENNTGVHQNQALVIVNYGNAKGEDIHNLACKIQDSVTKKFNILLNLEVNII
ncbi:MAG: UDP-N-acetylmuramate dehydrogenase [Bacteroidales bacterium]|jgi:UDP-N-acetylmuramate dehydrogenase|nr:UDP-N-acetylmuramate dehydrogenase [Bacteroidales bacterium]